MDAALFESHKENIQPMVGGRSASKLGAALCQGKSKKLSQKDHFESLLKHEEDLDDPLQVYWDYVQWTHNAYPQGQNHESELLPLLERCTSNFRDVSYYKNDVRYLNLWLEYKDYSDNPRDVFVYLAKKEIGYQLALFYEAFAQFLEVQGRLEEALQVYEVGIDREARPLNRLRRSHHAFKTRNPEMSPPEYESTRPRATVLSVKQGPMTSTNEEIVEIPKKRTFEVFQADTEENSIKNVFESISDSKLGSIKLRTKENTIASTQWRGEIIRQKAPLSQTQNSKPKIPVYRDSPQEKQPEVSNIPPYLSEKTGSEICSLVHYEGKKSERLHIDLNLLYSAQEEVTLKELLVKKWELEFSQKQSKIQADIPTKSKAFLVPLKDDDSTLPRPNSPTVTLYTREANNEVLSIFNNAHISDSDGESDKNDEPTNYDGFVTETINMNPPKDVPEIPEVTTPPTDHYSGSSSPFLERPSHSTENYETFNPMDCSLRESLLKRLTIPVDSYPGFHKKSMITIGKLSKISRITEVKSKLIQKGATDSIINYLGNEILSLRYELGKGGYGTVYLVETENGEFKALKVETPATKWEFYIMVQLHNRIIDLPHYVKEMFIKPECLYYFEDESYLTMKYASQGTILDSLNMKNGIMEEVLVIFLTVEILKCVEILHSVGIIHGDIKPDNFMMRFCSQGESLDEQYHFEGKDLGGWEKRGLTMIDFGRAIDMNLFKGTSKFLSSWKPTEQDCPEMHKGVPWSYEADYYGVAAIIHIMLFGKYIQIKESEFGMYKFKSPFKRYWQTELWGSLIDLLLNSGANLHEQNHKALREHRQKLEIWLQRNSISRSLKSMVLELENDFTVGNKKLLRSLQ